MNIHSIKKAAAMAAVASAALWSGSVRAEADGTRIIQNFIRQLDVGRPVSVENLTVVPVYIRRAAIRSGLTTLDEAIQNGWLVIKELEGGRVPQVELTNKSERTIFILAGEILTGCKQDGVTVM